VDSQYFYLVGYRAYLIDFVFMCTYICKLPCFIKSQKALPVRAKKCFIMVKVALLLFIYLFIYLLLLLKAYVVVLVQWEDYWQNAK